MKKKTKEEKENETRLYVKCKMQELYIKGMSKTDQETRNLIFKAATKLEKKYNITHVEILEIRTRSYIQNGIMTVGNF